jgi:hypothetical protein
MVVLLRDLYNCVKKEKTNDYGSVARLWTHPKWRSDLVREVGTELRWERNCWNAVVGMCNGTSGGERSLPLQP